MHLCPDCLDYCECHGDTGQPMQAAPEDCRYDCDAPPRQPWGGGRSREQEAGSRNIPASCSSLPASSPPLPAPPPRCVYPGCPAAATHRVFRHPRAGWVAERYPWHTRSYCRWHATVVAVQANARGCTPDEVLRPSATEETSDASP